MEYREIMCGIVGAIYREGQVRRQNFEAMRDTLAHRGPDDADSRYYENDQIALGFRRLSFLDLSETGRQPMCNEDETVWIVFNGEVYNYLELRQELEKAGHRFKSQTDTEVLIHGYETWGKGLLTRLKGMFAFCLLDLKRQKLLLARDHFGIKPLYYRHHAGHFVFASELKAIVACEAVKPELDLTAVADYLVYRYVPSPKTIWSGIAKLPPAHLLEFDYRNFTATTSEYWQLPHREQRADSQTLVERTGAILAHSVAIHARADVPVGSFLSGGYDSSAVVYYLRQAGYRPETFSIGFADWDDSEHNYAAEVAGCLDAPFHYEIANDNTLDLLEIMPNVYDEPIADISILPTWLVSRQAAKRVKAVMSGEGADELLGGYWWQKKMYDMHPSASWKERWKRRMSGVKTDIVEFYADAMAMGRFDRAELESAFAPEMHQHLPADPDWFYRRHFDPKLSPMKAVQMMDIKCFMGELVLVKMDRASMAHSLEVRVPFLDHELYEMVFAAPEAAYFRPDVTKFLLHEQIKCHLPQRILDRPKQGFVGPLEFYENFDRYRQSLQTCRLVEAGILRREYIDKRFEYGDNWRLWKITVLENWFRRWLS
jgi:asparagine synthase (glutamine-hydrolysing)